MTDIYAGAGAAGVRGGAEAELTFAHKSLIFIGTFALLVLFGVITVGQPRDRQPDMRGRGDDQAKPGFGFDAALCSGLLVPDEHTMWHYGPPHALPTNWSRHRGTYPRRPNETMERMMVTPMNHPAFPKRDYSWYYCPPGDEDEF